jgi:hypothetical protein
MNCDVTGCLFLSLMFMYEYVKKEQEDKTVCDNATPFVKTGKWTLL